MERNKGGCCGKAKALQADHDNLKKLFDIALQALKKLEAKSFTADDALRRMRLIDPAKIDSTESR